VDLATYSVTVDDFVRYKKSARFYTRFLLRDKLRVVWLSNRLRALCKRWSGRTARMIKQPDDELHHAGDFSG